MTIRKYWSVFALVLTFAVGFVLRELAPTPVQAAGGAPVTIQNTPLPVSAAQSGPWSVGVNNFPAFPAIQAVSGTVGVSNFPGTQTVSFSETPTVKVTNTTTPLSVTAADNPDLQPFAQECTGIITSGFGGCVFTHPPSGYRFVIEMVSGTMNPATGVKPSSIDLVVCTNTVGTNNYFPAAFQGSSAAGDQFTVNQQVRLYTDIVGVCGISTFGIGVTFSANTVGVVDFTISGHMVKLP